MFKCCRSLESMSIMMKNIATDRQSQYSNSGREFTYLLANKRQRELTGKSMAFWTIQICPQRHMLSNKVTLCKYFHTVPPILYQAFIYLSPWGHFNFDHKTYEQQQWPTCQDNVKDTIRVSHILVGNNSCLIGFKVYSIRGKSCLVLEISPNSQG